MRSKVNGSLNQVSKCIGSDTKAWYWQGFVRGQDHSFILGFTVRRCTPLVLFFVLPARLILFSSRLHPLLLQPSFTHRTLLSYCWDLSFFIKGLCPAIQFGGLGFELSLNFCSGFERIQRGTFKTRSESILLPGENPVLDQTSGPSNKEQE